MANPYASHDGDDPFASDRPAPPPPARPAAAGGDDLHFFNPTGPTAGGAYVPPGGDAGFADMNAPHPGAEYDGAAAPPAAAGQGTAEEIPNLESRQLQSHKFWTMEFYQQFFDIDSWDVLLRIANVMLPVKPPDYLVDRRWHAKLEGVMPETIRNAAAQTTSDKERFPDLYGPFWLTTTLWVTIGVVGNALSAIAHRKRLSAVTPAPPLVGNATAAPASIIDGWNYDFTEASIAAITFYAYTALMSLCIWGLMKWKAVPCAFLDIICLWGYSMFTFLVCAILCAVPSQLFQWVICFVCCVWSIAYLLVNFWQLWKLALSSAWFIFIVAFVIIAQIGLTLALRLYFFKYDF